MEVGSESGAAGGMRPGEGVATEKTKMIHCGNTKSEVRVGMQGLHETTESDVRATKIPQGHRVRGRTEIYYKVGSQGWDIGLPWDTGLEVRDGIPRLSGSQGQSLGWGECGAGS